MKTDLIAKGIQESLGSLVEEVLTNSTKKIEVELSDFKKSIEAKFANIHDKVPVMHIKFKELPDQVKKLSGIVNPYLPRVLLNSKLGLYTMLVGPAGCGKTTLANQVAESLEMQFASVCLTAGASETWLFGRQTPNGFVEGPFAKLYKEGGVFLADEMDAADANLLLSLNTALSHDKIINPMNGEVLIKHKDFIFIGAANTNGKGANHVYTGRTRLDAATLDRFNIIDINYDSELEKALCPDKKLFDFLCGVRESLKKEHLDEFISSRAFKSSYLLAQAGLGYPEIINSLISNWGDSAKSITLELYDKSKLSKEASKKLAEIEIPF
jgi:cobaltochelatase CobS